MTQSNLRSGMFRVLALAVVLATALCAAVVPAEAGDPDMPLLDPPFTLGGADQAAFMPSTAIQGPVAVAVYAELISENETRVVRRFSEDGGETWSTSEALWDEPARYPQVAIVGSTVHVVFEIEDPVTLLNALAVERTSTDGGKTFGPVKTVGNAGDWDRIAGFGVPRVGGYKNTSWVTWVDENGDLRLQRQQDGGAPSVTVIEDGLDTFVYSIANDGNNVYVLSMVDDSGIAIVLYRSTDGGLTFAPGKLVAQPRDRIYEGMALAAFGRRVVMAWKPSRANTLQVRLSKDRGATFSKPLLFKANFGERVALSATLDRIEMLRVLEGTNDDPLERLVLYVLPKGTSSFKRPLVLRKGPHISAGLFAPPAISSDNTASLYSWFEYRDGLRKSRCFVRVGTYLQ